MANKLVIKIMQMRRLNKRGDASGFLADNAIYLVLTAVFLVSLLVLLFQQSNGAASWEDFYAKEITKMINLAEPGDEIWINVQKGTEAAFDNGVSLNADIFEFNNERNEICIHFAKKGQSCYFFINDVDVVEKDLKLGVPENVLRIKIGEKS